MLSVSRYFSTLAHTSSRVSRVSAFSACSASIARDTKLVCPPHQPRPPRHKRRTHHGQRVLLEHRLLVVPLGRDERRRERLARGQHERRAARRLERAPVERDRELLPARAGREPDAFPEAPLRRLCACRGCVCVCVCVCVPVCACV